MKYQCDSLMGSDLAPLNTLNGGHMSHSDYIQLAIAYSDSVNAIVEMVCRCLTVYFISQLRGASQPG